jgi:hypothetical protein
MAEKMTLERMAQNAAFARRVGDERTADYWTEQVEGVPSMASRHFADSSVFRSGTGSESLEITAPYGRSTTFGVSMDSFDAPEIGLRLDYDASKALAEWLVSRLSEVDHRDDHG